MGVESTLLTFVFDIANWFMIPAQNKGRQVYTNMKEEIDIPYSDKCEACKLDVYYQEKKPAKKRPAVVNIHGGGLIIGDKINSKCYCWEIAGESDTVVFSLNYGLPKKDLPILFEKLDPKASHSDKWLFPLPLRTHMDALRFVAEHAEEYGVDMDNVFIAGDSAGSQMTGMLAACFCSEEYRNALGVELPGFMPKGFIMNCGLYNMDIYKYIPIGRCMMQKSFGMKAPHLDPMWKYHNPIPYINNTVQNAFVVKGITDILTIFQSDWMVKRLKEVGVPTEYYVGRKLNPMYSFHDFLLSPHDEGKKALAATREWIAKCSEK